MFRAGAVLLLLAGPAFGQAPALRFQWQKDQTLDYRVTQTTKVRETTVDEKGANPTTAEIHTELSLAKRWTVRDVDAAHSATLELTITQMRQAIKQPDGKTTTIDSANPEDAKQMAEFLNKPVLTLRVDARVQILDVKEAKPGSASRIQTELPFRMVLPEATPGVGQAWQRAFAIKLDPPHGTGESYDASQAFSYKGAKDGLAVVGLETTLKAPPKTAGEKIPLVPLLWSGDVYFNTAAGRYHAARLSAKAELTNHQGEGTKFVYESAYAEDLTTGK